MKRKCIALFGWVSLLLTISASPSWAGPPRPATDDEIKKMIADAGDAGDFDKAALAHLLIESDVHVQDSGLATTETCQLIKILTDEAVRSQSVQRIEFDPSTNRVAIKSARIHRKDGKVEDTPASAVVTQPTPQFMIYWGGSQHMLALPRLEIGDVIELRTSKTGYNIAYLDETSSGGDGGETLVPPMPGHWYEVTIFPESYPVVKRRYSVHMPAGKPLQYEIYNGEVKSSLWFDGAHHIYTFEAEDMLAFKSESNMAARDDCATKVVMATVTDWEAKSRWFHQANEAQFEADDAIRAKVAEITAGFTDIEDKIAACNHWVADNIRYYGTSRGPCEGFTLHSGIETFRDRGGVCKDKAGMLVTMLRVLGVDAVPTLTMAGSRVEAIPADQFNHTVTGIREKDGSFRVLDPTWIPNSREMWSSREAVQGIVYGTPEGQPLMLTPYFEPAYNSLAATARSTIDADGTLLTNVTMELKGYPCTYLRRSLHGHTPAHRRSAVEAVLNMAPNARLVDLDFTDPRDYSRDSHVNMTVAAERYAPGDSGLRIIKLPLMTHPLSSWFMPDLFYSVEAKERKYPLRLRATRLVKYEETVTLPDGWTIEKTPEAKTLDAPAAALAFSAKTDGNALTYTFEISVKQHMIEPKDYADYKKTIEAMKEISNAWIVCRAAQTAIPDQQAAGAPSSIEVQDAH